jgi:hypothetical protein
MLIFQIYEILADQLRWLKKQIQPVSYQAVVFGIYLKYKDQAVIDSITQIGRTQE